MKRVLIALTVAATLASCRPQTGVTPVPGQGAITIEVIPNPIVARVVSGDQYEFPFEVVVRETGGRAVEINRVTAAVTLTGGLSLGRESWDAARIRGMGYRTTVPPRGELRYRFSPRKNVPDPRFLGSVTAQLTVEATDDTGKATSATTAVGVRT